MFKRGITRREREVTDLNEIIEKAYSMIIKSKEI